MPINPPLLFNRHPFAWSVGCVGLAFVAISTPLACSSFGAGSSGSAGPLDAQVADGGNDVESDGQSDPREKLRRYSQRVMADSPRAYFRLNESVGAQLVYDEVSNQRMTPASSVTFGVPGPFDVIGNNKAARFDGPTSRIEHADPALVFNANRSFSVELWMQPKVSERYMHAVSQQYEEGGGGNSVLHGWALVINLSEGLFLERFVNGERRSTGAGALTFDQNTTSAHVVGTYDGSSMRLYVGGQLVSQTLDDRAVPKDAMTTSITIGNSVTGAYFEGVIDEVAVYDKALNADAIAAHLAP